MDDMEMKFSELFTDSEEEELTTTVILNDEDGNDIEFEFLDVISYENDEYVVLLPTEEEESGEVVILKLENADTDEETYVSVDNEDTLNAVFDIFKEKFKDEFDFSE